MKKHVFRSLGFRSGKFRRGMFRGSASKSGSFRNNTFRSRTPKPFSRKTVFIITLLITAIVTMQSFIFIAQNLKEPIMRVAKIRVKQIATDAINRAIADRITTEGRVENLIDWQKNHNGDITGFMLNYAEHSKITSRAVNIVTSALENNVHLTEHIPIGQALNSPILSTFGPTVPIRFESAGAPRVGLGTKEENTGINMLLVTIYLRITTEVMIYIPFDTAPETITAEIPISYILVKGNVPMYYFDAKGNSVGGSLGSGSGGIAPPPVAIPPPPDSSVGVTTPPSTQAAPPQNAPTR